MLSARRLHTPAASAQPSRKVCSPPAKKPAPLCVAPGALTPLRAEPCSKATAGPGATYHEGQGPLPGDDANESRQQHLGRQTCGKVRRPARHSEATTRHSEAAARHSEAAARPAATKGCV